MDLEAVKKKLPFLKVTEEYVELNYFGEAHRISRADGTIRKLSTGEQLSDFRNLMILYHLLYYSKENPRLSGEWVPFRLLRTAGVFDGAYQKMVLKPFAASFHGKLALLEQVVEELGYPREAYGDVSVRIPVFDGLSLILIFWDGDEEYPAQANLLFDKNITDFTHPETVVLIAEAAAALFLEHAGLPYSAIQDGKS